MKRVVIFDCGSSLSEVSEKFGCAPNWIMSILEDAECSFKWIKSYEGQTVTHEDGDAWIITGSPCSVYDELDWMLDLEKQISSSHIYNIPILGICFGHQLIAKSYGGEVELNPQGWELGAYPIKLTKREGFGTGSFSCCAIFSGISGYYCLYFICQSMC